MRWTINSPGRNYTTSQTRQHPTTKKPKSAIFTMLIFFGKVLERRHFWDETRFLSRNLIVWRRNTNWSECFWKKVRRAKRDFSGKINKNAPFLRDGFVDFFWVGHFSSSDWIYLYTVFYVLLMHSLNLTNWWPLVINDESFFEWTAFRWFLRFSNRFIIIFYESQFSVKPSAIKSDSTFASCSIPTFEFASGIKLLEPSPALARCSLFEIK